MQADFILSHPIPSSYLILSYPIPSYPILSHPIPSYPMPCHRIPCQPNHPIPTPPTRPIQASPSSHVRLSFVIDEEHYEAASFRLADMLGGLAASGGRPASGELALPEAKRQKSGGDE